MCAKFSFLKIPALPILSPPPLFPTPTFHPTLSTHLETFPLFPDNSLDTVTLHQHEILQLQVSRRIFLIMPTLSVQCCVHVNAQCSCSNRRQLLTLLSIVSQTIVMESSTRHIVLPARSLAPLAPLTLALTNLHLVSYVDRIPPSSSFLLQLSTWRSTHQRLVSLYLVIPAQ